MCYLTKISAKNSEAGIFCNGISTCQNCSANRLSQTFATDIIKEPRKNLGVIGGMGSRAGLFFLKKVIDYSPAENDQEFLNILYHNNSSIPDRTRAIIYNEPSPLKEILKSISIFNENEVDVIVLSCITSYYFFSQFSSHAKAKVLNPLQLLADYLDQKFDGVERIGILATTGTIQTRLFQNALSNKNIEIITLSPKDQEDYFMNSVYMKNGFKSAVISDEAKVLMLKAAGKLREAGVDLIIGGCTEVSLGIDPDTFYFPYLDMLDFLAEKTVEYCY